MIVIPESAKRFVGQQVYAKRRERNLTQKELGDLVECSQTAISKIELGVYELHTPLTLRVLTELGLSLEPFMVGFAESQLREHLGPFYERLKILFRSEPSKTP